MTTQCTSTIEAATLRCAHCIGHFLDFAPIESNGAPVDDLTAKPLAVLRQLFVASGTVGVFAGIYGAGNPSDALTISGRNTLCITI